MSTEQEIIEWLACRLNGERERVAKRMTYSISRGNPVNPRDVRIMGALVDADTALQHHDFDAYGRRMNVYLREEQIAEVEMDIMGLDRQLAALGVQVTPYEPAS